MSSASQERPSLIFVHGAFCGGWAFERFTGPFEAAGYHCRAPHLRGHAPLATRHNVAACSMSDYAQDIADLVRAEPRPPILIGHSLGGLVVQMAAQRAPVAGLALLAPSAPWGVSGSSFSEAISAASIMALGPFPNQAVDPDHRLAELYSLDRVPAAERPAMFERMRPESGRALWETLTWFLDPFMTTQVSPAAIKVPVFAAAGGADMVNPPATVTQTAERIGGKVVTFPGMSHWLIGETGWEAVAKAVLDWVEAR